MWGNWGILERQKCKNCRKQYTTTMRMFKVHSLSNLCQCLSLKRLQQDLIDSVWRQSESERERERMRAQREGHEEDISTCSMKTVLIHVV